MKTVPHFLREPFWYAMNVVLEEIIAGSENRNVPRQERAWKAFLFLPRLLLHRRCRGGKIGREKLKDRFEAFRVGDWTNLWASSIAHNEKASTSAMRKRCTQDHGDLEHRVRRAMIRIQLGELPACRMASEGADLAPGTQATLTQLRQRPARPRDRELRLPPDLSLWTKRKFASNLRSFVKGTAGSPSWMTDKHLRPQLDKHRDLQLFFRVSELLARGAVPESVVAVLRRERMIALQKKRRWGPRDCGWRCGDPVWWSQERFPKSWGGG